MSYENVVGGKLKLKGKALDVKLGSIKKKKKKETTDLKQLIKITSEETHSDLADDVLEAVLDDPGKDEHEGNESLQASLVEDNRTDAEKRYHEQKLKLDAQRLKKVANKSHRERIEEFNQYLANLSEHYDIPKVGPG